MPAYKIAIPSYGRAATIRTPALLPPGADFSIIVHTEAEAYWYRQTKLFRAGQVKATGCAPGIARQRNWILENLVKDGQWVLMLDDNIEAVECVADALYGQSSIDMRRLPMRVWHDIFKRRVDWQRVHSVLLESIERAERDGARLIGFANNDNPMFNRHKWRDAALVVTKMALVRKTLWPRPGEQLPAPGGRTLRGRRHWKPRGPRSGQYQGRRIPGGKISGAGAHQS